jgi:hypothetical protein
VSTKRPYKPPIFEGFTAAKIEKMYERGRKLSLTDPRVNVKAQTRMAEAELSRIAGKPVSLRAAAKLTRYTSGRPKDHVLREKIRKLGDARKNATAKELYELAGESMRTDVEFRNFRNLLSQESPRRKPKT